MCLAAMAGNIPSATLLFLALAPMSPPLCRCVMASMPGGHSRSVSAGGALVGAIIGALTFRSGLRGSYFALVTLAFAEVLRILASVAPLTGAGVGILIALDLRPQIGRAHV